MQKVTYPNSRDVYNSYGSTDSIADIIGRVTSIDENEAGTLKYAAYTYLGAGTIIKVEHPQVSGGLNLTYGESATPPASSYAGFDNLGRVVDQLWENDAQTTTHDQFKYGYDGSSNRTWRENAITHGSPTLPELDEFYTYDDLNRLINTDRGTLTGTHPDYSAPTTPTFEQDWQLNPTGNWNNFIEKTAGTTTLDQAREHNLVNEIGDITEQIGNPAWVTPAHDSAGNMSSAPWPSGPAQPANAETTRQHYTFDAWNRLREIYKDNTTTPGTHGDLVAAYEYDGINRRIKKTLYNPTEKPKEKESLTSISITPASQDINYTLDYYYNTSRQVIEIQKDNDETNPYEQYVFGLRYIHAPILRTEDHNTDSTSETLYYCNDANMNVTALVDPSDGLVVERYTYDPYGKCTVLNPDWSADEDGVSDFDNEILYCGYRYDPESGLFQVRHRYLQSTIGRWLSQDPKDSDKPSGGYHDGMSLYQYSRSNTIVYIDPFGLKITIVYIHSEGTYPNPSESSKKFVPVVGHTGLRVYGTTKKGRLIGVKDTYDYDGTGGGGGTSFKRRTYAKFKKAQAKASPDGKGGLRNMVLKISQDAAEKILAKLESNPTFKPFNTDTYGVDDTHDNCNSSISSVLNVGDWKIPDKEMWGPLGLLGLFTDMDNPYKWGEYTVKWLRDNNKVKKETWDPFDPKTPKDPNAPKGCEEETGKN